MGLCESLCEAGSVASVVIPGEPVSKARPRWNAGRKPYTPRKTIEGEKAIAWSLRPLAGYEGNVAVACIFRRSSRRRIDVDNLLKTVLDGGTRAGVWDDDSQVTALVGIVEHDRLNPGTVVCVGTHRSSLTRGDGAKIARKSVSGE